MKITIIGGGAAGLSTFIQLINKLITLEVKDVSINLVEKNESVGPGSVYGTDNDVYLINLPAKGMSPTPEYPNNFIDWLHNNPNKWKPFFPNINIDKTEFPPRRLFGLYLADLSLSIKEKAESHSILVNFIKDEVVDILPQTLNESVQYQIVLSSGNSFSTDQIILCLGHLPSTEYKTFLSNSNYLENPWGIKQKSLPNNASICILGSRLTAIDATLGLVENGHTGKIFMVSRGGLLPNVIGQSESYELQYVKPENISDRVKLDELLELFWAEIEHAEGKKIDRDKILHPQSSSTAFLEREITFAKSIIRPWQSVLVSIYPLVPYLWDCLNEEGKSKFLNEYYSIWLTYLAAFPIENAEKILTLLKSGQLEIFGGLSDVKFNDSKLQFEISVNQDSLHSNIIEAKYIINSTGAGHDITQVDFPLLKNLLEKELIVPHLFGGILIDFKSLRVKGRQNHLNNNIFVVGDLAFGALLATSDLSQINNQAIIVTNFITEQLACKKKDEFTYLPLCTTKPLLEMQDKKLVLQDDDKTKEQNSNNLNKNDQKSLVSEENKTESEISYSFF